MVALLIAIASALVLCWACQNEGRGWYRAVPGVIATIALMFSLTYLLLDTLSAYILSGLAP
jgi:hypothetical protein